MKIMSDSEFKSRLKQAHENGYNAGYVACLRNQERLAERRETFGIVEAVNEAFRKGEKIE